ncbi:MAG: nucleotidyltransferase domain-containing protein, partial [Anaeroplasmataceae bacterium]|nr:nucleotidyltransferase domain-containing protein [Anaeroplasmataceae bacterium]
MKQEILKHLKLIEEKNNVKILYAVESGSRAWGFASTDSDYDVRFIYVRKKEDYLRLDPYSDVIEYVLDETLDINGWDISKALKLLFASNPTLIEWLFSPIVYLESKEIEELRLLAEKYYSPKTLAHHYQHIALNQYKLHISDRKEVRLKKYFYFMNQVLYITRQELISQASNT